MGAKTAKTNPLDASKAIPVGGMSMCRLQSCAHPLLRNGRHVNKDKSEGAHCLNALIEDAIP